MKKQLTRAVETALVMVDALLDPEDTLMALIYLQGFFYGEPRDSKAEEAAKELAELVLENIQESPIAVNPPEFVSQRITSLLTSIECVLEEPERQRCQAFRRSLSSKRLASFYRNGFTWNNND